MGDFYDDMAQLAQDLLAPTSQGGLGQGTIEIERTTLVPAVNEWTPPTYTYSRETLKGTARGVSQQMVGAPSVGETGPTILSTDLSVTCTPPRLPFKAGDSLLLDGRPVVVIRYDQSPAIGTPVTVRFIVRS